MKFKKQCTMILSVAAILALLTGCSNNASNSEGTDLEDTTTQTEPTKGDDFAQYDVLSFEDAEIKKSTVNEYGENENCVEIKIKATNKSDKTIRKIMTETFIYDKDGSTIIDRSDADFIDGSLEPGQSIYIYVDSNNFNDKENVYNNIDKAVISQYSYYIGDDSVTIDQKSETYAINYTTY